MKFTITASLLLAGGFALGLVVNIALTPAKPETAPIAANDLYRRTEIPLTGYKSY